jgi:amino acid transporter
MACAGALPMKLCAIGKNRRTPWLTIAIVGVFAAVFALVRNIEDVAEFTNFATLLAFVGVNASALKIFAKNPVNSKSKHILMDMVLPLIGCCASLWLAVSLGLRAALFGGLLLVVGIMVYFLIKRLAPKTQE